MAGERETIAQDFKTRALDAGFDVCRITTPCAIKKSADGLYEFLRAGHHGDMAWLAREPEKRADPKTLWQDVRSLIVLGASYAPAHNPLHDVEAHERGLISVYARRRDYHDSMKKAMRPLARWLGEATNGEVKIFVDTAPVLEKPLAQAAGLGWQGKHTNLVSRDFGSWLFLGVIFCASELPADAGARDQCGTCQACVDVCPTGAIIAPYKLDARKCISYLTIEHKGVIERDLRPLMGNHIYGCDDCLAVCPWNKFSSPKSAGAVEDARDDLHLPDLLALVDLDDEDFRKKFAGTAIKRTGRARFIRNVLIAIANMAAHIDEEEKARVFARIAPRLDDEDALVRGMAVYASARLNLRETKSRAREAMGRESDANVRAEWQAL